MLRQVRGDFIAIVQEWYGEVFCLIASPFLRQPLWCSLGKVSAR